MIYFIYALIGICTGLLAVLMTVCEEEFSIIKSNIANDIISGQNSYMWWGYFFFVTFSVGLSFVAVVLVVYLAP